MNKPYRMKASSRKNYRKQAQHVRRYRSGRWTCVNRGIKYDLLIPRATPIAVAAKLRMTSGPYKENVISKLNLDYLQSKFRLPISEIKKQLDIAKIPYEEGVMNVYLGRERISDEKTRQVFLDLKNQAKQELNKFLEKEKKYDKEQKSGFIYHLDTTLEDQVYPLLKQNLATKQAYDMIEHLKNKIINDIRTGLYKSRFPYFNPYITKGYVYS